MQIPARILKEAITRSMKTGNFVASTRLSVEIGARWAREEITKSLSKFLEENHIKIGEGSLRKILSLEKRKPKALEQVAIDKFNWFDRYKDHVELVHEVFNDRNEWIKTDVVKIPMEIIEKLSKNIRKR